MARVTVSGATGFIGRHLISRLERDGHEIVEVGRRRLRAHRDFAPIEEIGPSTDWSSALNGTDVVVHLAGLAHRGDIPDASFFAVNAEGTARLIECCGDAGVRGVIFISSIAAREGQTAYGRSKLAGEVHVGQFADAPGKAGIILRPPLVYGADAPGNWRRLQRLAASGLPLPFGSVRNRRSMCSIGNICDAIAATVGPASRGERSGTYEIADREAVSLRETIKLLRAGMGRPARLLPVPPSLLRGAGRITGRSRLVTSLIDDLTLDPNAFMEAFAWRQIETAQTAIENCGRLYASGVRG